MTTATTPQIMTTGARSSWMRRLGTESAFLLVGLPLAILSFTIVVTGLSLTASLLITLIGIPVLLGTLWLVRGVAAVERRRLGWVTRAPMADPGYRRRDREAGLRGWLNLLRDRQPWLDLAYGLLLFPVALATFIIAVTWWATALYGLTWPLFGHALDATKSPGDQDLPRLLGFQSYAGRSAFYMGLAVFCAVTLPFVVRGLTGLHVAMGRAMLTSDVAALQQRVATLTASRSAAAEAEATSLRRLERDLHDGPQQRLVRIAMDLSHAQQRLDDDPASARPLVDEALDQTREAIAEVRALSRGIAPPVLADRGLAAAIAAVASRATADVNLDVHLPDGERLSPSVESAAYFIVAEALTNVAKHAHATHVSVDVRREAEDLVVDITDDGVGGANLAKGHGLAGLADRAAGLDGTLEVSSPPGGPTSITGRIPCA